MKIKGIWVLLVLAALILLPASSALAEDLEINGAACILIEPQSGQVLYEENADAKWYPASVTKIMTLVLALEAVDKGQISLTDNVTTSEEAASMGGSQVYLYTGEVRTVNEMLIAVAVGSGNDASVALAEHVSGSLNGFVELMNEKARELGMTGTKFANPHGLHDANHYTTARDLGILARYAIGVPHLLEYTSIYEYDFRPEPKPLKLWNTNRLLKWYDGVDGLKTGYTQEAKRNLVSTAQRDGLRLVAVVLGVEAPKGHFTESMKLLNYGFNKFSYKQLYQAGDVITQCGIEKGALDTIDLVVGDNVGMIQAKGEEGEIKSRISCPSSIPAPVNQGDRVGELILEKDGVDICTYPLLVGEDVPKGGFFKLWSKLLHITGIWLS